MTFEDKIKAIEDDMNNINRLYQETIISPVSFVTKAKADKHTMIKIRQCLGDNGKTQAEIDEIINESNWRQNK